jgi:autotransporter-associated beta strand protein
LEISAVIWDDGESPAPGFVKTGTGTLILSGNNSFSGPITINQGVISISTIAGKGQACSLGRGDLTLNGGILSYTGTGPNVSTSRGLALGTGGGTVDVQNAATTLTFTGAVTGGQAGLMKTGSGTLILNATSTYTGPTVVSNGTLQFNGASAAMNVFTNAGGVDVTGGCLVLDYSASGTSVASTVQSLLKTAYNNGTNNFQTGQIRDTLAMSTPGLGLGWVDNATTHQVTIMPALYGDANLSGKVDFSDLSILLSNYGKAGTYYWSQGDFNYDGTVNFSDLSKLLANYGKSGPLNIGNIPNLTLDSQALRLLARDNITVSGTSPVPEPSSLVMLALLLALGGTWRMRRR